MNKDEIAGLIRDLRTHAYDDCGERDIPTHIGNQAADALTTLSARVETLEAALRDLLPEAINDRYATQSDAVKNAQSLLEGSGNG